jgi:hypothetical protein
VAVRTKTIALKNRQLSCCCIQNGEVAVEILPEAGFSLISFKYKGRELLDQWDLAVFTGTEADRRFASENVTDTFRKGFGPSIGPWFGGRTEGDKAWNHGVCRFADWSGSVKPGKDSITGRLNGSKERLLGVPLDGICGFHLDIEIKYALTGDGLEYSLVNRSEGKKGTYGIHWYFKSPAGTRVIQKTDMGNLPDFDKAKFQIQKDVVVGDPGLALGQRFDNLKTGLNACKTRLAYPDGLNLDFRYSDSFRYTMLFSAKQFVCVEPISGPAWQVGTFETGVIKIRPGEP